MPSDTTLLLPKAVSTEPVATNKQDPATNAPKERRKSKQKLQDGIKKAWNVVAGDDGEAEVDVWQVMLNRNATMAGKPF